MSLEDSVSSFAHITHCKPLQNTQHHRLLAVQSSLTGLEPQSYTEWLFLHLSLSLSTLTPAALLVSHQDRFPSRTVGQGVWENVLKPWASPLQLQRWVAEASSLAPGPWSPAPHALPGTGIGHNLRGKEISYVRPRAGSGLVWERNPNKSRVDPPDPWF